MLAPLPVIPSSPMDVGGVFSATFTIVKRRFGLFLGLSAISTVLPGLLMALTILPLVGLLVVPGGGQTPSTLALVGVGILGVVAFLAAALVPMKCQAMMAQTGYEVAQGQQPTLGGVWARTNGFLRRYVPSVLAVAGLAAVAYGIIIAVALFAITSGSSRSSAPSAGLVVLLILMVLLVIAAVLFLAIRLLYWLPAAAVEQRRGIDALGRSWRLTSGSFWRTLGYYLLALLTASLVTTPISFLSQGIRAALGITASNLPRGANPAELFALAGPALIVSLSLQLLISLLLTPLVATYVLVMFLDQVRRVEGPVAQAPAWQPTPFYAAPGSAGGASPAQPWQPSGPSPSQPGQQGQPWHGAAPTNPVSGPPQQWPPAQQPPVG